jgi:hypothetical protein
MKRTLHKLLTGILVILPVYFLASCQGPQGEPGKDGQDAVVRDTAYAVNAALAEKTGGGDDPWVIRISGVDISDPGAFRHIIHGITSAIEEGDIELDLSGCTGTTFAYIEGVNRAAKLRVAAITLPASLTHIVDGRQGYGAFNGYTRLGRIRAPGLTHIGDYAFYSHGEIYGDEDHSINEALTEVYFPEVLSVGAYAFRCPNLSSIKLPKALSIGDYAFVGDASYTSLTEVDLPSARSIGAYAFYAWRTIASINLPEVRTIGNNAFAASSARLGNTALTALSLSKCESIGEYAFMGFQELATVSLPSITSIGISAFGAYASNSPKNALRSLKLGPTVPTSPDLSTIAANGIFVYTAAADDIGDGTIAIQVPESSQGAYDSAGWRAIGQGLTDTDTINYGTNHKAITISTYTED